MPLLCGGETLSFSVASTMRSELNRQLLSGDMAPPEPRGRASAGEKGLLIQMKGERSVSKPGPVTL